MKLVDIADQIGCSPATIRTWKNRYKWDNGGSETFQKKSETKRNVSKKKIRDETTLDDGTKETLQNDDLTPEQQIFCIYYSRTFNAAQSYQKAYGCSYESAIANGSRLLTNDKVRAEIERLKEIKRQQIVAGADDIVELQMRIAFADIGNYVSFGQKEVTDIETDETYMVSVVDLKESKNTDTQLIQEVKRGKDGVSVKLADKQKAIDWLSKYFLVHPDDKYKAEFDKKRAEVSDDSGAQILQNMQTIADILQHPVANRSISDLEEGDADE
uniref:Terminase small subunit n=2 Tax=root TaxID=1 RepID=A0A8S5SQN5_9CAUD|nr:MAG TPA: Terminase small subunit [Siphoviridae sp. cto3L1]